MKKRLLLLIAAAACLSGCTFGTAKDGSMFGSADGSDIVEVLKVLHEK